MTNPEDDDRWIREALIRRDLDRIPPNMSAAGERINDANRNVKSARTRFAESDLTTAISACHDAVRKAITGHMTATGYRPGGREGTHRIVIEYARRKLRSYLEPADLDAADVLRRTRGDAEYGDFAQSKLQSDDVIRAADLAQRIVNGTARALKDMNDGK